MDWHRHLARHAARLEDADALREALALGLDRREGRLEVRGALVRRDLGLARRGRTNHGDTARRARSAASDQNSVVAASWG